MTIHSSIQSIKRYFHRHFFDKVDPAQNLGTHFPAFSIFHLYSDIDYQKTLSVCKSVYERILNRVCENVPKDVKVELISFADQKLEKSEGVRDYIVITRMTARKTRSTIIVRCLPYGRNVYLALDSYALGTVSVQRLLFRIYISIIPFILLLCPLLCALTGFIQSIVSQNSDTASSAVLSLILPSVICSIPVIATIIFIWLDLIRSSFYYMNISLALREVFGDFSENESFNADDVFMFLKSVLPIVIESIRQVFEENNIDVKTLDEFATVVNNVNNINETFINYAANQGIQGNNQGATSIRNLAG